MSANGFLLAGMLVAGVAVLSPSARASDACVLVNGFDANGFDANGFDRNGFDRNGFNANGFDANGFNRNGFNSNGLNPAGVRMNGVDSNGFDANGFDSKGFDVNGFNANGLNANGFNSNGFNANGVDVNGYNSNGINSNGLDINGYDANGFNANGFNSNGVNRNGFNSNGVDSNGLNGNGFDANGFNRNGLDANGFNSNGFHGNGYDRNGVLFQCGYPSEAARLADPLNDLAANSPRYDISCLDRNGYDIKGYDSRGIDRNGWYRPDLRPVAGQDPSQQPLPTESCVPLQKADGTVVSNPACARRNTIFEPDACALANAVVTWPPSSTFYGSTAPPAVIGWDVDVANLPAGAYRCPWNGEFTGSGFNSQGFDVSGYGRDGFNHVNFSRTAGHRPRLNPPCDPGPTVTFLTAPATIAAGLPAGYLFQVSPDPGGAAVTATCNGASAELSGSASPYAFSCVFTGPGTFEVRVAVATTTGSSATVPAPLVVTAPPNDFSISAVPAGISVAAGGSAASTISTAITSGSAESVALSASGLPAGVTVSFTPASVSSGQGSTMTVTTAASAAALTSSVTVTGTASSGSHATTVSLTVNAAPPSEFSLSVKPVVALVQQGRTVSFAVSTAVTSGAAQTVNLSVTGLPVGTVAQFVPAIFTTGGKSVLSVSVGRSTRLGVYPLKIRATSGAVTHATTVWLAVFPHF
jgi:hypothetical protein